MTAFDTNCQREKHCINIKEKAVRDICGMNKTHSEFYVLLEDGEV